MNVKTVLFILSAIIFPNSGYSEISTGFTTHIPAIAELLDPAQPWGLNLEKVDQRQKALRKLPKSNTSDISTLIVLYQKNKSLIRDQIKTREKLNPMKDGPRIHRINTLIISINDASAKIIKKIRTELGLKPEQIALIPAYQ